MPFEKGQSGNPGGRSKVLSEWRKSEEAQRLRDIAYETLEAVITADSASHRDKVIAAGMLLDRTEGKPIQAISGPDGGPIQTLDLSNLTVQQLEELEKLRRAAMGE